MPSPYNRGYRYEDKARRKLRQMGFFVVRSAGSKFPDLVAIKDGETTLFEVKKSEKLVDRKTINRLKELGNKTRVKTGIIYFREGKMIVKIVYNPKE